MDVQTLLRDLRGRRVHLIASGDELRCEAPPGVLTPEVLSTIRANKPALLRVLRDHSSSALAAPLPLVPCPSVDAPLSFSQERVWYLSRLTPGIPYHSARAWQIDGRVGRRALRDSLDALIRRHEALRTTYALRGGELRQTVREPRHITLEVLDVSDVDPSAIEARLREVIDAKRDEAFDLAEDLLLKAYLLRVSSDRHVLLLSAHQIVYDGATVDIVVRELTELYAAHVQGRDAQLVPLTAAYVDFAYSLRRHLAGPAGATQQAYWARQLERPYRLPALPRLRTHEASRRSPSRRVVRCLAPAMTADLRACSRSLGVTFYTFMLAATKALVYALTGQEDVIFFSYVSLRHRPELHALVGLFTNLLLTRGDLSGSASFVDVLRRVSSVVREASAHREYSLGEQFDLLRLSEPDAGISPYQICFVFVNDPKPSLALHGAAVRDVYVDRDAYFDLVIHVNERADDIELIFEHRRDLYLPLEIEQMLDRYLTLLKAISQRPDAPLSSLCAAPPLDLDRVGALPAAARSRSERDGA